MKVPMEINGKEYDLVDNITLDGKDYIAYEDKENIYINAYTVEGDKLNILDITEQEKEKVMKELGL